MNHTTAERTMAVERYLLDEFSPDEKDAFEDHFFSCDECAREVKAGVAFMSQAKESLNREEAVAPQPVPVPVGFRPRPVKRDWFAWLRPAFAVPAMALMLGVLTFQNLVQLPAMHESELALHQSLVAMNTPGLLPDAYLKSGAARGDEVQVVTAKPGDLFQLTIDIPDTANVAHIAEIDDAAGKKLGSIAIPADAPKDGLALKMPGDLAAGSYSLVVRQAGAPESDAVSHYNFELRRS